MKKTLITDWQSLEKMLEEAVTESLRGDNWKKFAKLESEQTNKKESKEKKDK